MAVKIVELSKLNLCVHCKIFRSVNDASLLIKKIVQEGEEFS